MTLGGAEISHRAKNEFFVSPPYRIPPEARKRGMKALDIHSVVDGDALLRSASRHGHQLAGNGFAVSNGEVPAPEEHLIQPCAHAGAGAIETEHASRTANKHRHRSERCRQPAQDARGRQL